MTLREIVLRGSQGLEELTGRKLAGVVGIERCPEGWRMVAELVEKSSIPQAMDILGIYEAWLDDDGCITRFERRELRKRGDIGSEA